ncbi:MAG: nuclear transport factor 2 family protein [Deltaproteobacteria bacterium]|nr:nuclear transport factor 2 family protein [Deltaproteobacteria bacterium]MBK8716462.1 nuclear transport factor 2 family protein [Deltaproteobacteria bacterium]MBP7287349.1 nuclear transport factor 2 family protein [Nannocystaceae bacterium]
MFAETLRAYYDAFNAGDRERMLAQLTDDVIHDVNQGGRQLGKPAFAEFLAHMDHCYRERVEDLVVMVDPSGTRGAAEFTIVGEYLRDDDGLPPAKGQRYRLPVVAAFAADGHRIARVSNYYNLADWIRQVGG